LGRERLEVQEYPIRRGSVRGPTTALRRLVQNGPRNEHAPPWQASDAVLCGDPYIDWDKIKTNNQVAPFLGNRDRWYARVVKDEVLAKHHRAFLIAGSAHFLREQGDGYIEPELRRAGAKTFVILAGTNAVKG